MEELARRGRRLRSDGRRGAPALGVFFVPDIGSGFGRALVKVSADLVDTVQETCLKSLRDGDSTELDATTLIGAERRLT